MFGYCWWNNLILIIYYMKVIEIISFILPFINEIANVLTSSGYKPFKNLYKPCIDSFLINDQELQYINKNKLCKKTNLIYRLIIDLIALIGVILNIAQNTIQNGYIDGVLSGINIICLSFIIPNLFLHKIIHYLNFKTKIMKLLSGIIIIGILFISTILIDKLIDELI